MVVEHDSRRKPFLIRDDRSASRDTTGPMSGRRGEGWPVRLSPGGTAGCTLVLNSMTARTAGWGPDESALMQVTGGFW